MGQDARVGGEVGVVARDARARQTPEKRAAGAGWWDTVVQLSEAEA